MRSDPPDGTACWPRDDSVLDGEVAGPADSPYAGGVFKVVISVPPSYPFSPPSIRFVTRIFHPNICSQSGAVCLSVLKPAPHGDWKPSLGIASLLVSIRALLSSPNAADGLDADATALYRRDRAAFVDRASRWTTHHAKGASKRPRGDEEEDDARETGSAGGTARIRPRPAPARTPDAAPAREAPAAVPGRVVWVRRVARELRD